MKMAQTKMVRPRNKGRGGLAKTVLQGTVRGGRKRGRQKKRWEDNIAKWTGLKMSEAVKMCEGQSEEEEREEDRRRDGKTTSQNGQD